MRIVCDRCDKIMDSKDAKLLTAPNNGPWYLCSDCFDNFLEFLDELRYPSIDKSSENETEVQG